jgi:hypothetical protein
LIHCISFGDQLKYPSTKDSLSQLITPLRAVNKYFTIEDSIAEIDTISDNYTGYYYPIIVYEDTDSAFIWFEGPAYRIGRHSIYSSLNQVLTIIPFNSDSIRNHFTYATRLFLTLGVQNWPPYQGDTALTIEILMSDLQTHGSSYTQKIGLIYGSNEDIYYYPENTRYLWEYWDDSPFCKNYTMSIPLDSSYYDWYIKEIKLRFNKNWPEDTTVVPNNIAPGILIYGINLQTFIDVHAPVSFYQGDYLWKNDLLNNSITVKKNKEKCINPAA